MSTVMMRKRVKSMLFSIVSCFLLAKNPTSYAFYTSSYPSKATTSSAVALRHRAQSLTRIFRTSKLRQRPRSSTLMSAAKEGREVRDYEGMNSCSSDRRDFVRSAGLALLTGTGVVATIFGQSAQSQVWAVGLQPGERETAPPPPLLLVPALRAKLAVQNMCKLLEDPQRWGEVTESLKAPPLAAADFKACFRTYSDADPEQHLQFDLYRIQAQDALKAVSELLAYLASEKKKGNEILPDDVKDLREAGRAVVQGIDDFLQLAPREDVIMVERNTREAAAAAAASAVAPLATESSGRAGTLRSAVAGEGAFVGGAWLGVGR